MADRDNLSAIIDADLAGNPRIAGRLAAAYNNWQQFHQPDVWQPVLIIGSALCYLYTRDIVTAILVMGGYYLFETIIFYLASALLRKTTAKIERFYSRELTLFFDFLVIGLALFSAYYVLDFTVFGSGVGSDPAVGMANQRNGRTIAVLVSTLLIGVFPFFFGTLLLLTAIWIVYLAEISDYTLWLAGHASIFVLFYMSFYVILLGRSYLNNSFLALLVGLLLMCLIELIALQM